MECTLQRKHDERYENKRKEALARISSLVALKEALEELKHSAESRDYSSPCLYKSASISLALLPQPSRHHDCAVSSG